MKPACNICADNWDYAGAFALIEELVSEEHKARVENALAEVEVGNGLSNDEAGYLADRVYDLEVEVEEAENELADAEQSRESNLRWALDAEASSLKERKLRAALEAALEAQRSLVRILSEAVNAQAQVLRMREEKEPTIAYNNVAEDVFRRFCVDV